MATLEGGNVFWFPLGSKDHVSVTNEVMSYEVDGELRLAEPIGTLARTEITFEPEDEGRG